MSSQITGNLKIREAMAALTHPEYDQLPESIKLVHSAEQFMWLGSERERIIERETMPDFDVIE